MDFTEKTLDSTRLFEGRLVSVRRDHVRLSDGSQSVREVVDHPGGVVIAAVQDDDVYIVEQFRYPMMEMLQELPAGKLEWGEDPDRAAERELKEETGLTAGSIRRLGVLYPSPGYCGEKLYLYLATQLRQGEQDLDEGELLHCRKIPLDEALSMVYSNDIRDSKTIALLTLVDHLRREGRLL